MTIHGHTKTFLSNTRRSPKGERFFSFKMQLRCAARQFFFEEEMFTQMLVLFDKTDRFRAGGFHKLQVGERFHADVRDAPFAASRELSAAALFEVKFCEFKSVLRGH